MNPQQIDALVEAAARAAEPALWVSLDSAPAVWYGYKTIYRESRDAALSNMRAALLAAFSLVSEQGASEEMARSWRDTDDLTGSWKRCANADLRALMSPIIQGLSR